MQVDSTLSAPADWMVPVGDCYSNTRYESAPVDPGEKRTTSCSVAETPETVEPEAVNYLGGYIPGHLPCSVCKSG